MKKAGPAMDPALVCTLIELGRIVIRMQHFFPDLPRATVGSSLPPTSRFTETMELFLPRH